MTREEFEYIKRAVEALERGDHAKHAEAKILQTMSEITAKAAKEINDLLVDNLSK